MMTFLFGTVVGIVIYFLGKQLFLTKKEEKKYNESTANVLNEPSSRRPSKSNISSSVSSSLISKSSLEVSSGRIYVCMYVWKVWLKKNPRKDVCLYY